MRNSPSGTDVATQGFARSGLQTLQKSRWADRDEASFYINVGACSKRWLGIESKPVDGVVTTYLTDLD
jgi:hypothetical protein